MFFQNIRAKIAPFLWIISIHGFLCAQETVNFTAFGHHPQNIPDSLYQKLEKTSNTTEKAEVIWSIGKIHLEHGNTDSIIHYATLLKEIDVDLSKTTIDYKSRALWLLGQGKLKNGLYEEALKSFINGIDHSRNSTGHDIEQKLRLGLAISYYLTDRAAEAKPIFKELQQNKIAEIAVPADYYLALVAKEDGALQEAKLLFKKAIERSKTDSLRRIQFASQLQLGQVFALEDAADKAFLEFESVLQEALKLKYYDLYTEAAMHYGELNTQLNQYESAEMVLAMAYTNSINWNNLSLQKKIINSLRKTYEAKGEYENAYNLMTQYVAVSDKIEEEQNIREIQDLEVQYRTLQKENTILELKEEKLRKEAELIRQKTVKKAFLIGFLALLVPIIALLFVYYQKLQTQSELNQQQKELSEQRIKSLKSQQELELAKASLNAQSEERARIAKQLHDGIGGNLAGIKLQLSTLGNRPGLEKEIMGQVDETYELVREISHNLTPKIFMKSDFTSLLEQFSEKINSTLTTTFSLFVHPKKKFNQITDKLKVEVYQIVQELTTNALKHAKADQIELHLNIHGTTLQLLFEDNGIGFETDKTNKGIGLNNIQQRLQGLNASMILDSALTRGTAVTIEIPLN
jgi:signal transduction histidine kinase